MFLGEFRHSLDEKGRLSLPAAFRAGFAEGLVLARGVDRHLTVHTRSGWEVLAQKILTLPQGSQDARNLARLVLAGAVTLTLDKAGRVLIPEYLRDYAQLETHAVVAGLYDRLEIWSESAWEAVSQSVNAHGSELAEKLTSFGF